MNDPGAARGLLATGNHRPTSSQLAPRPWDASIVRPSNRRPMIRERGIGTRCDPKNCKPHCDLRVRPPLQPKRG
jgi:hypothetical protein